MYSEITSAAIDLMIPISCVGCGVIGISWCLQCVEIFRDVPVLATPRVHVGCPVFSLGRYEGVHRQVVISVKERGRRDAIPIVGRSFAKALLQLYCWSELPDSEKLVLIPLPSRRRSARKRGGDPVLGYAENCSKIIGAQVLNTLITSSWVRDSAGLNLRERMQNLEGAISVIHEKNLYQEISACSTTVVILDDVLTTGVTARESVKVLGEQGIRVDLCLVVAAA